MRTGARMRDPGMRGHPIRSPEGLRMLSQVLVAGWLDVCLWPVVSPELKGVRYIN